MKKSELRTIIKEELNKILKEDEHSIDIPTDPSAKLNQLRVKFKYFLEEYEAICEKYNLMFEPENIQGIMIVDTFRKDIWKQIKLAAGRDLNKEINSIK